MVISGAWSQMISTRSKVDIWIFRQKYFYWLKIVLLAKPIKSTPYHVFPKSAAKQIVEKTSAPGQLKV